MIIDSDKHPERNLYFIGAKLLELIKSKKSDHDLGVLFRKYNQANVNSISFDYMLLALDWLFILGTVDVNKEGNVRVCS